MYLLENINLIIIIIIEIRFSSHYLCVFLLLVSVNDTNIHGTVNLVFIGANIVVPVTPTYTNTVNIL